MMERVREWLRELLPAPLRERYHRYALRRDFGIGSGEESPRRRTAVALPAGLNVIGYLDSFSGVGESARAVALAAEAAGIAVERIRLPRKAGQPQPSGAGDVNLYHVNADGAASIVEDLGWRLHAGHHNVAYWYWESDRFPPKWRDRFAYFDEIWVASEFCRGAIEPASPIPVQVVPPAVAPPAVPADPGRFTTPEGFFFLSVFDALSLPQRKNPVGTIRAFAKAFPEGSGVTLRIQAANAERVEGLLRDMRAAATGARVVIGEGRISGDELAALFRACGAYVSLHRAEGFGFPLAEAMSLGKPVVATDYSGSRDFLDETTGFPVRWSPNTLPSRIRDYEAGTSWAEPDEAHAVEMMRRVYADPAERVRRGEEGRRRIGALYAPAVAGERIQARLRALRARAGKPS